MTRSSARLLHRLRGLPDGGDDPRIGPASADVAVHGFDDLLPRGPGMLAEQGYPGHDHPAGAIAALHGAGVEEGVLERMEPPVLLEPLDRGDLAGRDGAEPGDARANRLPVDEHGAGAAAAFAAAV